MKATIIMFILAAFLLISGQAAHGVVMEANTAGAGGGTASSSNYSISYTIGQTSVIGKSEAKDYNVNAGFWYCWNHLEGDVNNDCIVDIIDLVLVRKNLNAEINADNWRADVNNDGQINVLDLILVRNSLGSNCGE